MSDLLGAREQRPLGTKINVFVTNTFKGARLMIPPGSCYNSPTLLACGTPGESVLDGSLSHSAASQSKSYPGCAALWTPLSLTRERCILNSPLGSLQLPRLPCSLRGRVLQTPYMDLGGSRPFTFQRFWHSFEFIRLSMEFCCLFFRTIYGKTNRNQ